MTWPRVYGILTVRGGLVQIHDVDALALYAAPMQDIFERERKAFGGGAPQASAAP